MTTASVRVPVLIVGGGQAGLAMSYCLTQRHIEHVVLEKHRMAHAWRSQRWDSFCLVTPNWQCRLPGHPYSGDDPDGFMLKHEIVAYLEEYAQRFAPPLLEQVEVQRIRSAGSRHGSGFAVDSSQGRWHAEQVVIAAGGYHRPKIPAFSAQLPSELLQLDASHYRSAAQLPEGAVMVVGSGQSGCQIAEDLHLAGRKVHLCTGSAPRVSRRYRGKDVVAWLDQLGHYDLPIDRHPDGAAVRKKPNHYVTGRDGGRDIDLRRFALEGMELHGRLLNVTSAGFELGGDLAQNLERADATNERIKRTIDQFIARAEIPAPPEAPYLPPWQPAAPRAELSFREAGVSALIWCMGFALDYRFVELPVLDASGYPEHERGVTKTPGLYFLGLPWQYTWGSGRFCGVGRDAEHLAQQIALRSAQPSPLERSARPR